MTFHPSFKTFREFIAALPNSPYTLPHFFRIQDANIDGFKTPAEPFEEKKHYFTVRVNEMYIRKSRKRFSDLEPMVVCVTEYQYGSASVANPMIVGSDMLKTNFEGYARGFSFRDTRVADIHPYAGGRVILSIGLYENGIDNYLVKSVKFLENISKVFNSHVTVFMKTITTASQVIMTGVDELLQSIKTKPFFGLREEFDPAVGNEFIPGYYVLLNGLGREVMANEFYVDDQHKLQYLVKGKKQDFHKTEYILFSFVKSGSRNNTNSLPLHKDCEAILTHAKELTTIGDQEKEKIKNMLRALNFDIAGNPDLTEDDPPGSNFYAWPLVN